MAILLGVMTVAALYLVGACVLARDPSDIGA